MKIDKIDIIVVGALWRELTIVELTTDTGITGPGEVRMVNKTDTLIAAIQELAQAVVAKGYRGLKIDPFGAASAEITRSERNSSLSILEAVREAVGPDVNIFLVMHGRFTAATAMAVARDVIDIEPGWLEESVIPTDITGLRQLRRSTHLPIAAGERMHAAYDLRPFLEEGLVDIYKVDLTHAGGITGFQQLSGWTNADNTLLAPHNVCGPIGTAASLHVSAACPNFKVLEHFNDFADPWVFDIVQDAPRIDPLDGCFAVPTRAGLGVTLNRAECEKHPRTGGRLALFNEGWEKRASVETCTKT